MGTGKTYSTKYLLDSNNSSGVAGQVLSTTSTGIDWVDANTVPGTGLWLANGNDIYNSNSGNVGIGNTSPAYKLSVQANTAGDYAALINNSNSTNGYGLLARTSHTGTSAYALAARAASSDIFVVRADGNVGINTTSPQSKLQIDNTGSGEFAGANSSSAGGSHLMLKDEGSTSRTLMSGPSIVFQTPASADGTNVWATSRLLGSPAAAGSARGTFSIQVRDQYDPFNNGTSWNWRTCLTAINTGNVGIGTNSPSDALEVAGNNSTQHRIRINNAGTGTATLAFMRGATFKSWVEYNNSTGNFDVWQYTNNPLRFATNNIERMRIDSAGNVGIGTTGPTALLEVKKDNATIYDATSDSGQDNNTATVLVSNDNVTTNTFSQIAFHNKGSNRGISRIVSIGVGSASTDLAFVTENNNTKAEKMRITSAGNVGIGLTPNASYSNLQIKTPSSAYGLDLVGRDAGSSSESQITFWNSNQTSVLAAIVNSSDSLLFYTGTTERMRLVPDTGSSFAILKAEQGTYSSIAALSLYGTNSSTYGGSVVVRSSILSQTDGTAFGANLIFKTNNTSNVEQERIRIDSSGNVGIGMTSPSSFNQRVNAPHLVVGAGNNSAGLTLYSGTASQGSINFADGTTTTDQYTGGILYVHGSDNYMTFYTNGGGEKMRIGSDGAIKFNTYNLTNQTGTPTYLLGTDASGNVVKTTQLPGGASAPMVTFSRAGINSSTYTMIATVNGNNLASIIQMTMTGTSGNVVFACTFDITVNHYEDIHVKSTNGDYTEITLRITSNDNEDYSIEAKHNGSTATTAEIVIFPLANEIITPTTTDPGYTGEEYEHTATEGWRFGGSDGGVESSNLIADGNVGIGTTSPSNKLHVKGNVNGAVQIEVDNQSTGNASYAGLFLNGQGNNFFLKNWGDQVPSFTNITEFVSTAGSSSFVFSPGTSEKMRITAGGNVGIGTTSPGAKLQIVNTSASTAALTVCNFITGASDYIFQRWQWVESSTNYRLDLKQKTSLNVVKYAFDMVNNGTGYNDVLVLDRGNVGIGTASPGQKLQVDGGATGINQGIPQTTGTTQNGILRLTPGSSTYGETLDFGMNVGPTYAWIQSTNKANLNTNYSLALNPNGGNVGIGTTSPNAYSNQTTLTINGSTYGRIDLESGGTLRSSLFSQAANTSLSVDTGFFSLDTGGSERMRITSTGNVGIGTGASIATDVKLHIKESTSNSYARLRLQGSNRGGIIEMYNGTLPVSSWTTDQSGNTHFATSGAYGNISTTTRLTILTGGNVGIGVTNPDFKLQIATPAVLTNSTYSWPFDLTRANSNTRGFSIGVQSGGGPVALSNHNGDILLGQTFGVDANGLPQFYETMRVKHDGTASSGNVGIGTDSPTNDGATATTLEVRGKSGTGGGVVRVSNAGNTASARFFAGSASATIGTFTNHDLAISTNNSLKMIVKAGGNVGIGTTNPGAKLEVDGTIFAGDGNKATPSYSFGNDPDTGMFSDLANTLRFGTGANTRMTIEPSGEVGINTTGPSAALHLRALTTNGVPFKLEGDSNTTVEQMLIITSKAYNSTDAWYNLVTQAGDGSGGATNTCIIERDGDLRNKNNSYGQISDSRLKENIIDATPKLEDVMKVKVKNFNFIGEDLKQIGVVAQELEEVFPGLVKEEKQPDVNGEEGGIYKSVKYSVLVPILVKAMQEQQEIIEDLKTRITKLEN